MNRESRRAEAKRKKAIGRELMRAEKPDAYRQGFMDGGKQMCRASMAAFVVSMSAVGFSQNTIIRVLRMANEKLTFFAGEDELIQEAFDKAGIIFDDEAVFGEEAFREAK